MCKLDSNTSLTCVPNPSNNRCVAEGHRGGKRGRYKIGTDGMCRIGRLVNSQAIACPVCDDQLQNNAGLVFNPSALDTLDSEMAEMLMNVVRSDYSIEQPICALCADELKSEKMPNLFILIAEAKAAAKKFVESFLKGANIKHRRQWIDNVIHNWCDCCGFYILPESMESSCGIVRGKSAVCLCHRCFDFAASPELPKITFPEAINCVMGRSESDVDVIDGGTVSHEGPPVLLISTETADEVVDGDEDVPPPPVEESRDERRRLYDISTAEGIASAILNGKYFPHGESVPDMPGKTYCTIFENVPGACESYEDGGYAEWEDMPTLKHGNHHSGICPKCHAKLEKLGIVFSGMMLCEAIGGFKPEDSRRRQPRPEREERPQPQTQRTQAPHVFNGPRVGFNDPGAFDTGFGKKNSSKKRGPTKRDELRDEARVRYSHKLASINSEISVAETRVDQLLTQIEQAQSDIEDANDLDDVAFAALMIEEASEGLELAKIEHDELLAEIDKLTSERDAMETAGLKPFIVKPPKSSKPSKQKKCKKKNGGEAAA